ncbi:hypothetical protein CHUAL_012933 [Chamberlinius hualienensis]
MRITDILFVRQALPRRLFSGRNRLPREVSSFNKKQVLSKLVDEEEALFYLRQPYLTKVIAYCGKTYHVFGFSEINISY